MDSIDIFLTLSYILIGIGVVLAIVMPLIKSLDNPKSLLKTGVGVVGLVVLIFISYSLSDGEVSAKFAADPYNMTTTSTKFVGAILASTYFLAILAMVGIVLTELNKAIK
ncbi:hypothetical protein [Belliella aquatica]|uniref:MotA/TolQ/ExbB proton channel family protein n=1 Tax=Belliella aquatica TaxID=1323734 RepID=A0ABQ1N4R3_9BACT|nr:hypothetical protein [Belliella aquatica]MCH7407498.1 hypothetical protein [Belliella aquatica]GGC54099.1 hypothetical protein GCM10010993_35610 [Belliella aquatica]